MPLPLRRITAPGWVPAGIFMVTGPSRVGTLTSAPSVASAMPTRTSVSKIVAPALETRLRLHLDRHVQVPGTAPAGLALALHAQARARYPRPAGS